MNIVEMIQKIAKGGPGSGPRPGGKADVDQDAHNTSKEAHRLSGLINGASTKKDHLFAEKAHVTAEKAHRAAQKEQKIENLVIGTADRGIKVGQSQEILKSSKDILISMKLKIVR